MFRYAFLAARPAVAAAPKAAVVDSTFLSTALASTAVAAAFDGARS
ncbi:hypothetical protein [Streptomyces sp. NPDC050848]